MSKRKYITQEEFDAAHKIASEKFVDKQPRLDRSAWEPCILCAVGDWKHLEYSFCPHCGRPLTDAAWEMLQKRLEGHK